MEPESKVKKVGNTTRSKSRMWDEYTDNFGNSTLEIHTPRKIWEGCTEHYFVPSDENGNYQCRNCSFGQKVVWGIQKVVEGKIISNK